MRILFKKKKKIILSEYIKQNEESISQRDKSASRSYQQTHTQKKHQNVKCSCKAFVNKNIWEFEFKKNELFVDGKYLCYSLINMF